MVKKRWRDRPYIRLLLPSLFTSWLAGGCFAYGAYFGSAFGVDWRGLNNDGLVFLILLLIPTCIFALIAVWPVAVLAHQGVRQAERLFPTRWSWPIWLAAGAVIGGPALFVYSFLIDIGHTLIGNLLATGATLGLVCAALARGLLGPNVPDTTVGG